MKKIAITNQQIRIDNEPRLLLSGELFYFRIDQKEWQDRITKLKNTGCNTVSTYIPWLLHEFREDQYDFGETRPELDIEKFIRLCAENGMYCIVRPGPFIMAEMKNEGIPYWVIKKHPEIVPVTWEGKTTPNPTLDYLHPSFLSEVRKWYSRIMPILSRHLYPKGGNILMVQLDNEIGMLSWVSNSPDLTDFVLTDFFGFLHTLYPDGLQLRYGFDGHDPETYRQAIRFPEEKIVLPLMQDLGNYMRKRYKEYVLTLRKYSEEFGVKEVPFLINIHGTGGGRGTKFPIGISQLYETYQDEGFLSGSDVYFGDFTLPLLQDMYILNAFLAATNGEKPLTSIEFSCGSGDYGNNFGNRHKTSDIDFKTRLFLAQGNKLLNYYAFAGGSNYRFDVELNDGNDRTSITGEHHGFAAPVLPNGKLNYVYERMARTIKTMMNSEKHLARMQEESDNVAVGFIPDYFMTEYWYPKSIKAKQLVANLEKNRANLPWENVLRAMLMANYRFKAIDIQRNRLDVKNNPVFVLFSALYMAKELQEQVVRYLESGGSVFLYGEIPLYDMEGNSCTVLMDALGFRFLQNEVSAPKYRISLKAEDWAAKNRVELHSSFAQTFEAGNATVIMRTYHRKGACGFDVRIGKGHFIGLTCSYTCDIEFYKEILSRLGSVPNLTHDFSDHGIFLTSSVTEDNQRFIHIINLDDYDKECKIFFEGSPMFDGEELFLPANDALMLPSNIILDDIEIVYATMEMVAYSSDKITFRLTGKVNKAVIITNRHLIVPNDCEVITGVMNDKNQYTIIKRKLLVSDTHLELQFQ